MEEENSETIVENEVPEYKNLSDKEKDMLLSHGYDPDNFNPNALSIGELLEMVENEAFGPDGIVISGDHGGPIPAE